MTSMDSQLPPSSIATSTEHGDLFHELPIAAFVLGPDLRIEEANLSWQRLLGHDRKQAVGQALDSFIEPRDRDKIRQTLQPLLSRMDNETTVEVRLLHLSGQSLDAELRLRARPSGGLLGTLVDLTARLHAESQRLLDREEKHQFERLESMGLLASGIAHDFNNLLMGMLGNADLALAKLSPFSPGCEHIRGIVTHARRAAELCRQLLAYAGKSNFQVETIDLAAWLHEARPALEQALPPHIRLDFELSPQLPSIDADTGQIRQLVDNLIENAAEAIGESDGTIRFASGSMECTQDYLHGTFPGRDLEPGCYVFLEVADDGCGLDEEARARIFDPFFSTKFSGRGLGLASVLGIARGHQATLKVESEPDRGTAIRIHFPCSAQSALQVSSKMMQEENTDGGAGTILVVDDEEIVRSVARGMLELLGYNVITAEDGQRAVEIYRQRQHEIVLIVLDLAMPLMSGEETFEAIRNLQSDAKVVLSSGYDEQEATQRFAGKGLAGFIQKPYEVAAFSRIIHDALESRP